MNPESDAAVLDRLRDQDQISSVGYALEIAKIWATEYDALHLAETGVSSSGIVEAMLADHDRTAGSFLTGYNGYMTYPIGVSGSISHAFGEVLGRSVHRWMDPGVIERSKVVATGVERAGITGLEAERYLLFANLILGTHTIYQYLDLRVAKKYKSFSDEPSSFGILPGKEETYWGSMLFSAKDSPGIYVTFGTLSRLMNSIRSIADDLYGYQAEKFMDTWWATVNVLKDQGEKYREAMAAPLAELLNGNLGEANYLLKERLYKNRSLLPYRARAKLQLDEDEMDYFGELFSIEEVEPDHVLDEVEVSREEMLAEARQFIGGLIAWTNDRDKPRTAYIRNVGIDRKFASRHLVEDADAPYTVVPYSLILDYFKAEGNNTFVRISSPFSRYLSIGTFSRFMRQNKVQLLAVGDRFADRSVTSFQVNG